MKKSHWEQHMRDPWCQHHYASQPTRQSMKLKFYKPSSRRNVIYIYRQLTLISYSPRKLWPRYKNIPSSSREYNHEEHHEASTQGHPTFIWELCPRMKKRLKEHKQRVKAIVYTLAEPLITVLTQIEYIRMLAKAAKNPYSDRQLFKIDMNIIRNKNDSGKGKSD